MEYKAMEEKQLRALLVQMVDKENFDEAAQIADELQSRREVPVDVHAAWLRFIEYYAPIA